MTLSVTAGPNLKSLYIKVFHCLFNYFHRQLLNFFHEQTDYYAVPPNTNTRPFAEKKSENRAKYGANRDPKSLNKLKIQSQILKSK